jgi:hypothetical protein
MSENQGSLWDHGLVAVEQLSRQRCQCKKELQYIHIYPSKTTTRKTRLPTLNHDTYEEQASDESATIIRLFFSLPAHQSALFHSVTRWSQAGQTSVILSNHITSSYNL